MARKILMLLAAILFNGIIVRAQDREIGPGVIVRDGRLIVGPEAREHARRRIEALEDPNSYTIRLSVPRRSGGRATAEDTTERESVGPYRVGSEISFDVVLTNARPEPLELFLVDPYTHLRPQLLYNGQPLPYHERAARLAEDRDRLLSLSVTREILAPAQSASLGIIKLSDWYEPLAPGLYELIVKYRVYRGGEWRELPRIMFEVVSP